MIEIRHNVFRSFVFGQAGVQGFFGETSEHPHHLLYRMIPGFSFENMVFVSKTITANPRIYPESSNTELKGYKLKKFFPKSIWVSPTSFIKGYMLNAVGLANLGASKMFSYEKWQERRESFLISFMPVGRTLTEKLTEVDNFCEVIKENYPEAKFFKFGLQVNFSCPNTGHQEKQDVSDIALVLSRIRKRLPSIMLMPKFNFMIKPEALVTLKNYCDAFCISNTLGFGELKSKEWWEELFPEGKSPLTNHFGGKFSGGLSGKPLFPILLNWLDKMEKYDDSVIIIAGGGIMGKRDIEKLSHYKIVRGIALGSVATLRPWRLQSLIDYGNDVFEKRYYLE